MFSNLSLILSSLKLNYYNMYLQFFFIFLFFCLLLIFNNYTKLLEFEKPYFFKNIVLFMFTTSFIIFIFYLNALIHFKSLLLINNLVFYSYKYNYMSCYLLDTSSVIILFLCYIVGLISIITLGDRF